MVRRHCMPRDLTITVPSSVFFSNIYSRRENYADDGTLADRFVKVALRSQDLLSGPLCWYEHVVVMDLSSVLLVRRLGSNQNRVQ